jgi:hypothetical protein
MSNKGIEMRFDVEVFRNKDWTVSVNANVSRNVNKVKELPSTWVMDNYTFGNGNYALRIVENAPVGAFYGYRYLGVYQNTQETYARNAEGGIMNDWQGQPITMKNGTEQVYPGDAKYEDINHDGVINDSDKVNLGNGMPDFTFGFSLGFDWKGLDFSVTANGQTGNKIVQSYRNVGSATANYTTQILDRWTGEGTSNKIPRVTNTNVNYQFSDLFIQDGDFLRISNITLGYDFSRLLRQKWLSQARLYFQVQNAFTFTKYDGMDPEIGYGMDGWVSGVDLGYYPRPRTFLFGVNLKF